MGDVGKPKEVVPTWQTTPLPPLSQTSLPKNPSSSSSLTKASNSTPSVSPSKPILTPPSPIWHTLQKIQKLETVSHIHAAMKEQFIEKSIQEMQKIQTDIAAKLKEAHQATQEVGTWGFLEDIGNTMMSSVSLFYGLSAFSSGGTVVGGALIASGILSVSNLFFKHTNTWDWVADSLSGGNEEYKSTIKTYLPCAVGLVAAATGLYGSTFAWPLAYEQGIQNQALSILSTASQVTVGLTAYASGQAQMHATQVNADLSFLQTTTDYVKNDLDLMVEEVKEFQKKQTETHELAAQLIEEANQTIQSINQPA